MEKLTLLLGIKLFDILQISNPACIGSVAIEIGRAGWMVAPHANVIGWHWLTSPVVDSLLQPLPRGDQPINSFAWSQEDKEGPHLGQRHAVILAPNSR